MVVASVVGQSEGSWSPCGQVGVLVCYDLSGEI